MNRPAIPLEQIVNSRVNATPETMNSRDFTRKYLPAAVQDPAPDPQTKPAAAMKIHIDIDRTDANGSMSIRADIDNMEDLSKFHEMYGGYLPRKKRWGLF